MRQVFLFCLCMLCSGLGWTQVPTPPCDAAAFHQFDFWLGSWSVYDKQGNKLGENTISSRHNHCLLQEEWKSVSGNHGSSFNFFDSEHQHWNQVWVDNQGGILRLTGNSKVAGRMVLESGWALADSMETKQRISWLLQTDSTVHQVWEVIQKDGGNSTTLFYGIYKKQE